MARARRASSKPQSEAIGDSTFTCPECGKTFTRAAALGAHRSRAHGIAGRSSRRSRTGGASRSNGTPRRSTRNQTQPRTRAASSNRGDGLNRDALLQTIFPNGLPAREAVIRRANAWLDEAEKLAKAR